MTRFPDRSHAPWFRRIHLVTAGHWPPFLLHPSDRFRHVEHHQIADPAHLPTFNSSAIISWIHRIPDLSERFVLFNDDVFVGDDVFPSHFFTPGGLPKLHFGRHLPLAGVEEVASLFDKHMMHMRTLLEARFGRTLVRNVRHVPHALRRDTLALIEAEFADEIEATRRHRFRRPTDLNADVFHAYYCELTGRGVIGQARYRNIGLGSSANRPQLEEMLRGRRQQLFCLNDTWHPGDPGIDDDSVVDFLERYFPVPSRWEVDGSGETDAHQDR